jgi:hypothetical protein
LVMERKNMFFVFLLSFVRNKLFGIKKVRGLKIFVPHPKPN